MRLFMHLCIAALSSVSSVSGQGHCIWYGECGKSMLGLGQNCHYTGQAKKLEDPKDQAILKKWCPSLVPANNATPVICCDGAQLKSLDTSITTAHQLIQRCPSCFHNFVLIFCIMTCSPTHSEFVKVAELDTKKEKPVVKSIELYLTSKFMNGSFDSCKNVFVPSMGVPAFDVMCGEFKRVGCTPVLWFYFMGEPKINAHVPFQIKYKIMEKPSNGIIPFNPRIVPCNESIDGIQPACGCVDCEQTCLVPPPLEETELPFTIFGIAGFPLLILLIFVAGTCVFLSAVCWGPYTALVRSDSKEEKNLILVPTSCFDIVGEKIKFFQEDVFSRIGYFFASNLWVAPLCATIIVATFTSGIYYLKITTNPVELWASPHSRARLEKKFFDEHFGPFFRTAQVIISAVNVSTIKYNTSTKGVLEFGPVFHKDFLLEILKLQEAIKAIGQNESFALEKICFAPLSSEFSGPVELKQCVVQSIWGYWQDDAATLDDEGAFDRFLSCSGNPYGPDCLARYGGPIDPGIALGGFLEPGQKINKNANYHQATALILTFLINNKNNKSELTQALQWEEKFIEFMQNYTENNNTNNSMNIAFVSERSIEDQLELESNSDMPTIVASYLVMFFYIAISLGQIRNFKHLLMDSKVTLGIGGVLLVLFSVLSSIGFYGYCGVPATLIIMEVIPFLVLAIGVDNIFILVQTHQRTPMFEGETIPEHMGRVVGFVGPSILLTSLSEIVCSFLGALSDMPAVKAFALYAGMACLLNFIFQITCFITLMALDAYRQADNRFDVFCCFRSPTPYEPPKDPGLLYRFYKNYYTPFVMSRFVRPTVIILFFGWFCASTLALSHIEVGLDQELAMPRASYVNEYFKFIREYLSVGPPVYFVIDSDLNMSHFSVQNLLCSGKVCDTDSITSQIYMASRIPETTYIARPSTSWIDDYFDWSSSKACCFYFHENNSFCPHTLKYDKSCKNCEIKVNNVTGRLNPDNFSQYLSFFLQDNPDDECPKAGHASYSSGVNLEGKDGVVGPNYFMTFHTVLKTSSDYYGALREARKITESMTNMVNSHLGRIGTDDKVTVFPYSVFYVFYEQYLTMWEDTLKSLSISLFTIFLISFLLIGFDYCSAFIIVVTISMIIIDLAAIMYLWSVTLNAVSLVNLVMAIGISVEFCSHITFAYATSMKKTRLQRAADSLTNMGSSVLSGITLTKFGGIIVLYFARSQIFSVFYFRMYLCIVLIGAAHGMLFLPVFLSYAGKKMKFRRTESKTEESSEEED